MNNIKEGTAATTIQRVGRGRAVRKNINKIQALKNQGYECPITNQSINRFNARLIRCGHAFQVEALEKWMTIKGPTARCPTCRAIISPEYLNSKLFRSALFNQVADVQMLLNQGADVDSVNNDGETLLQCTI